MNELEVFVTQSNKFRLNDEEKSILLFRYPMEKERRFRCGQSDLCISMDSLCDGISDCSIVNNNDDEILCPWRQNISLNQRTRNFICKDQTILPSYVRCNKLYECAEGEDEFFCYLSDPPPNTTPSLEGESITIDIIPYPFDIFSSNHQISTNVMVYAELIQSTIM